MAYKTASFRDQSMEPDIFALQLEAAKKKKMVEALRQQDGKRQTVEPWGVVADITDALVERSLNSDAEEAQKQAAAKNSEMIDQAFGFGDPKHIAAALQAETPVGPTVDPKQIAATLSGGQAPPPQQPQINERILAQLYPEQYGKMRLERMNETFSSPVETAEGKFIQTGNRGTVKTLDGYSPQKNYQSVNMGNQFKSFDPSSGRYIDQPNASIGISPNVSATLPIQQMNADTSRMNANLDSQKFAEEKTKEKAEIQNGMGLFNTPEGFNAIVDKVIAGDVDVPKRPSKEWNDILAAASVKDPAFKPIDYATRRATKLSATSGKLADSFNALNTIAGHLGSLNMAVEELDNTRFPWLNKKLNEAGTALGTGTGDNVSRFKATVGPIAQELTRVYRGAGGSRADVEGFEKSMNENASFSQQKAAIKTFAKLVQSKLEAATNQFNQGMKTSKQGLELLTPEAQATFKEILGDNSPAKGAGADKYNGFKILNVREK